MTSKYYAVRAGRKPGIYLSWPDCQAQTKGFKGAQFKSFESEAEARAYLKDNAIEENMVTIEVDELFTEGLLCAYTDGSFEKGCPPKSGYGISFVRDGQEIGHEFGPSPEHTDLWNVGAELKAATRAIDMAIAMGEPELVICHDLKNIQMWGDGLWKCNNDATQTFREHVQEARENGLTVVFGWVRGHCGDTYNEKADRYAARGAAGDMETSLNV